MYYLHRCKSHLSKQLPLLLKKNKWIKNSLIYKDRTNNFWKRTQELTLCYKLETQRMRNWEFKLKSLRLDCAIQKVWSKENAKKKKTMLCLSREYCLILHQLTKRIVILCLCCLMDQACQLLRRNYTQENYPHNLKLIVA